MSKSIKFVIILGMSVFSVACGKSTAQSPGTALTDLNGTWLIQGRNCNGSDLTSSSQILKYAFSGNAGSLDIRTSTGTGKTITFSVNYNSNKQVVLSGFGVTNCTLGSSAIDCANASKPADTASFTLGYQISGSALALTSVGATDILSCAVGSDYTTPYTSIIGAAKQ